MDETLIAGVSRADITPLPGPVLQGHWGAPSSHAMLRPLEVRAVVFESGGQRAAIATVDVIGVTRRMTDRIRATIERVHRIPADGVMVVASHTHCAPSTLPCMGLAPAPEWIASIEVETAACVGRAAADLQPVRIGTGAGEAYFNRSRRGAGGTEDMKSPESRVSTDLVDRRVRVLRIVRGDGASLATLFHYACHATTLSGTRGLVSPDFPGVARVLIDSTLGGTSLFLPGCGGDLRPDLDDPAADVTTALARLDECGRELAAEVCRVAARIDARDAGPVGARRTDVDVPFGDPPPQDKLRMLADGQDEQSRRLTGPWARKVLRLLETRSMPRAKRTEMQAITVGPLTWIGIPGEPLQAIGAAVDEHLRGLGAAGEVWPVGYANDEIGYLCTRKQYIEGGYEPSAYAFYDEPAPFSGEEDVIRDAAARLTS